MSNKPIDEKINAGREYRNLQVAMVCRARQDDNDKNFIIEGYAATFNEPYLLWRWENYTVKEKIDAHAFDECDMSDVIMQYNHEGRVYARTSNETLKLSTDDHGLRVEADLGGTEGGRQLYEEIRGGYITKMSFGFTVEKDEETRTEDKGDTVTQVEIVRNILKINKLYDVSAVSFPANDATEISARSYGEGVITEAAEEIRKAEERAAQIDRINKILQGANA